jgi:hypothetical protein
VCTDSEESVGAMARGLLVDCVTKTEEAERKISFYENVFTTTGKITVNSKGKYEQNINATENRLKTMIKLREKEDKGQWRLRTRK